jgi:hypothetical protein
MNSIESVLPIYRPAVREIIVNVFPGRFVHPAEPYTPNTIVNTIFWIVTFQPTSVYLS